MTKCKICGKYIKDDELKIYNMHLGCIADAWGGLVKKYPIAKKVI